MGGKTISEKIFSMHYGKDVSAGDIVVVDVDFVMGTDGSSPLAIEVMKDMGKNQVFDPSKVILMIDHYTPSPNEKVSKLHDAMRKFSNETQCVLYDVGAGICHQLMIEGGHVLPGYLGIGGDSHTCTYGALNSFSTGVGSTDMAAAMATGRLWFKVPETIKIELLGKLPVGTYSKDLVLFLMKQLTADGATYEAIEFVGEAINDLSMDARFTICNMAVEMGAKTGLMIADSKTIQWLKNRTDKEIKPVYPDEDAHYSKVLKFDVSSLEPQIAKPHAVDNVVSISELEETYIQQATIGSCTNGRLEDIEVAANILKGRKVSDKVRLLVTPASREIYKEAVERGFISTLIEAGATIVTPSCGWCCGSCNGIPSDGENVISTSNRNFKGRMGNRNANIYLASPAVVATSAIYGKITDCRDHGGDI